MRAQVAAPVQERGTVQVKQNERGFRPDIQGMRAIAVGMVVLYHLWPSLLPGGFAGVDVFFVISGFLITGHLWREYEKTGAISLVGFWGRRAKRLVPAAALVLTVTWVAGRYVLPETRLADAAGQIRASALYYQNWQLAWNAVDYLKSDDAASPVQHFWSLSVEEQFYLCWPLLFVAAALTALGVSRFFAWRSPQRKVPVARGVVIALAVAVIGASLAYSVYDTAADPAAAYFVTTTRMWELGLGGLLALLPPTLARRIGRHGWAGWLGLAMVAASVFALRGTSAFPGWIALLPAGGAALLIACGSDEARRGPSFLTSLRPMVFTGGISYSLYLWHWPVIVLWASAAGHSAGLRSGLAIIAACVALSWLSKVAVEDTVRRASLLSGHDWRSVSVALAAVLPVTLVTVYLVTLPKPWTTGLPPGYPGAAVLAGAAADTTPKPEIPTPTTISLPDYWQQGCLVPQAATAPKECRYGDTRNPVLTVALVGDSLAGDWFTPLEQIARQRHWELVTDLHAACPWTAATMIAPNTGGTYTACHTWGATVLHDLVTTIKPDVVITSDYPKLGTPAHPTEGTAAMQEIGLGMAAYWQTLLKHGISVLPIRETPIPDKEVPDCVAQYGAMSGECATPAAKAVLKSPPTVVAAATLNGSVPLIDMNELICAPDQCPPVVGNVLVYQDDEHLTSVYSLTTTPYLEKKLLAASKILAAG